MPVRPPEFDRALASLPPELVRIPKIIAVDGRSGSGKSTFGRFLAWQLNTSLIELDLFLKKGGLRHRGADVKRLIDQRLRLNRPAIVEGLLVLKVLREIGLSPDYLFYVENERKPEGWAFGRQLDAYDEEFRPAATATHVLRVQHDG